jgi:hypothetical protein
VTLEDQEEYFFDSHFVSELGFAAYLMYLGYPLLRTLTDNRAQAQWEFRVPDWDLCQEEWAADEPIALSDVRKFVAVITELFRHRGLAKSNKGEWINKQVLHQQYS